MTITAEDVRNQAITMADGDTEDAMMILAHSYLHEVGQASLGFGRVPPLKTGFHKPRPDAVLISSERTIDDKAD